MLSIYYLYNNKIIKNVKKLDKINVLYPDKEVIEKYLYKTETRGYRDTLTHLVNLLYHIREMKSNMDDLHRESEKIPYSYSERYMEMYFTDLYDSIKKIKYIFGW